MSRIAESLARLQASLAQLDETARERAQWDRDAADAQAELRLLKLERDRLQARIAELEEELRGLSGVNMEVESRLDGVIAEIRQALSRN